MALSRFFKSAIIVLALALVLSLGGRLLPVPDSVSAAKLVRYKVVSTGTANTVYEYEKLLNDMAFQGWTFDHMVSSQEWVVFKK